MSYHVEDYNLYRDKIKNRKRELEAMQSIFDLEEQDILHFLEIEKCNAVMMSKATKKLIEIRKARREVKEELRDVTWIWHHTKDKLQEMPKFIKATYKTNIMKEIKGD